MRGDAQVKQLLDSLVEIERERESYNAVGGVDPVFAALTARGSALSSPTRSRCRFRPTDSTLSCASSV